MQPRRRATRDRAGVVGIDVADRGGPAEGAVGEGAGGDGGLGGVAAALEAGEEQPADLALGEVGRLVERELAGEGAGGLLLDRPGAEAEEVPAADVGGEGVPGAGGRHRAADEAGGVGGVEGGVGSEILHPVRAEDEAVGLDAGRCGHGRASGPGWR